MGYFRENFGENKERESYDDELADLKGVQLNEVAFEIREIILNDEEVHDLLADPVERNGNGQHLLAKNANLMIESDRFFTDSQQHVLRHKE